MVAAVAGTGALAEPAAAADGPPPDVYGVGFSHPEVAQIQDRLKSLAYDPGPVDGVFGKPLEMALFAFQTANGLPVSGMVAPDVRASLANPLPPPLGLGSEPDRVEIDLARQLLLVVRNGSPALITHISSGNNERYGCRGRGRRRSCKIAVTPRGVFQIGRTQLGWRTGPLGRMHNPQYFTSRGHAIHGSTSVPLHPASHGCVRIPMHTSAWFPNLVFRGMPVYIN